MRPTWPGARTTSDRLRSQWPMSHAFPVRRQVAAPGANKPARPGYPASNSGMPTFDARRCLLASQDRDSAGSSAMEVHDWLRRALSSRDRDVGVMNLRHLQVVLEVVPESVELRSIPRLIIRH